MYQEIIYLGFAETAANARDVMEISTGLPCPQLPATFPRLLKLSWLPAYPGTLSDLTQTIPTWALSHRSKRSSLLAIHADAHQGNGSHHTKGSDLTKTSSSIGK